MPNFAGLAQPYETGMVKLPSPNDLAVTQSLQQKNALAGLDIQKQTQDMAQKNALRTVFSQLRPNPETGDLTPADLAKLVQADPVTGTVIAQHQAMAQQERDKASLNRAQTLFEQHKLNDVATTALRDATTGGIEAYKKLKSQGASDEDATAYINANVWPQIYDRVTKGGAVPASFLQNFPRTFDPNNAELAAVALTTYADKKKLEEDARKHWGKVVSIPDENGMVRTIGLDPSGASIDVVGKPPALAAAETRAAATNYATDTRAQTAADKAAQPPDVAPLDDATLDYAAQMYNRTGVMPPMGQGKAGTQQRSALLKRAAEIAAENGQTVGDVVAGQAERKAVGQSMTAVRKMHDAVEAYSQTALGNGDRLLELAQKADATGVPLIEKWIRAGRQATGDPDVAAFNAQMTLFRNEVAKIATNPNLTGVLTVESQREMEKALSNSASVAQIKSVLDTLKGDVARRRRSLTDQIQNQKDTISGKPAAPAAADGDYSHLWTTK